MPLAGDFGHPSIVAPRGKQQAYALADETGIFRGRTVRCMGAVVGEAQFVQCAAAVVEHVMGGTGDEGQLERVAIVIARNVLADVAVPVGVAWQARVVVHAVALQGDPVGAEVTFLEHMHTNALQPGQGHRRAMHGTAVTEQHQVGDLVVVEILAVERLQFLRVRRIDAARTGAVQQVADVEADAVHAMVDRPQGLGQSGEERRADTLQKQKAVARMRRRRAIRCPRLQLLRRLMPNKLLKRCFKSCHRDVAPGCGNACQFCNS
ncbi:hypothetical protein D3C80_1343840 [compost metagenome]